MVKIDVVSDVVLLLLLDETGSGVMICPGTGAVAPRMGKLRDEEAASCTEEDKEAFDVVLACLRGGGFTERSGWAVMKALKLGSVFGSAIFQGKRRRIMQRKMIATDQTSVFLGS
jgi:hypothetical protein